MFLWVSYWPQIHCAWCFKRPKLKTSEFGVRKGFLIKKMGALVVPHFHLKKVQSSGFLYIKGRKMGGAVGDWWLKTSGHQQGFQGDWEIFKSLCSSSEDIFLLILEREEERGKGREREKETLMWKRNINWLHPVRTTSGDQTYNLGMCPDWK